MSTRLNGQQRIALAAAIKADIDAACVVLYPAERRDHLGASVIGKKCQRALTYSFRWMKLIEHEPRMRRLFNHGHITEPRFLEWLQIAGFNAQSHASNGAQFRIETENKHFGGSLDGLGTLPPKYNINEKFLLEFKTYNDRQFKRLVKSGLPQAKPEYVAQMNVYGKYYKLDYGIHFGLNKNDDEIYVEVIALDHSIGDKFSNKAFAVISTKTLPPRIASNAAYDDCKFCDFVGICHNNLPVDINCRSCVNSDAISDGNWFCNRWQSVIPHDAIPLACSDWKPFE
jgi:hypothetical protein